MSITKGATTMKRSTGIVRKVDELGRVVLPKELRRTLGIKDHEDSLEIFVDGEEIILKKYMPGCVLCGSMDHIIPHQDKSVCLACANSLAETVKPC